MKRFHFPHGGRQFLYPSKVGGYSSRCVRKLPTCLALKHETQAQWRDCVLLRYVAASEFILSLSLVYIVARSTLWLMRCLENGNG